MRDHEPIILEDFNGLWARGSEDSCPIDHFIACNNIQFIQSGFEVRDGIDLYLPYGDVIRIYNYISQKDNVVKEGQIILNKNGQFFHTQSPTPFTPILTIAGAQDFGFQAVAGRAYITPRAIYPDNNGNNDMYGLKDDFLYVYLGDGTPARKAGGDPPPGFVSVAILTTGLVAPGSRVYAVAYETDTGFITAPSGLTEFTIGGTTPQEVRITNIPTGGPNVVARHILMTQAIKPTDYSGNPGDYELFFVIRIGDNTTVQEDVSVTDAELISSADYLNDLFSDIAAGVSLATYHGRLVLVGEYANISVARISAPGQPEAFDKVSGLITVPLDGRPLTSAQEYRDVLNLFKQTKTFAYPDNGGDPSSWTISIIDQGVGSAPNGVASILDSGGINIEFLIIADYSGIMLFNGTYQRPELTWKIRDFWLGLDRSVFRNVQILNDPIRQILYVILTSGQMLIGDYSNGIDYKDIRWSPWTFNIKANTICLTNVNTLLIGAATSAVQPTPPLR